MNTKYTVWPYVKSQMNGDWSIPDSFLAHVWDLLDQEGKTFSLFWNGGVIDAESFISWFRDERNFPLLLVEHSGEIRPVAVAWLNGIEANHALAHFGVIGRYDPVMADMVLGFWRSLKRDDGTHVVKTLLGFIPETNTKAIHTVMGMGFVSVGVIPNICTMAYEGDRVVGASLLYYDLTKE